MITYCRKQEWRQWRWRAATHHHHHHYQVEPQVSIFFFLIIYFTNYIVLDTACCPPTMDKDGHDSLLISMLGVQSIHLVILVVYFLQRNLLRLHSSSLRRLCLRICVSNTLFRRIVHLLNTRSGSRWCSSYISALLFHTQDEPSWAWCLVYLFIHCWPWHL